MKFEEWYKSYSQVIDRRSAESIWEACKQECLKSIRRPILNDESFVLEVITKQLIDRIEKEV